MNSAKALFGTLLIISSIGAMAQETPMDAAREQRMDASLQGFRTAHPDMAMGSSASSDSMNSMHKAHHSDGTMKHHHAKAGHTPNHKSATGGTAPMADPVMGMPKAATP